MRKQIALAAAAALAACVAPRGAADSTSAPPAAGVEVDPPAGWKLVAPDASVVSDTVLVVQGPLGASDLRPAVEMSRRELSAADRKRKPAHILTALALEIVQTFAAFDATGQPEEVEVAGLPAATLRMDLTEMLPDGTEAERSARFFAIVRGSQLWVVRCFGPRDRSADTDFDKILASISFQD
jgi:hypothetical protein